MTPKNNLILNIENSELNLVSMVLFVYNRHWHTQKNSKNLQKIIRDRREYLHEEKENFSYRWSWFYWFTFV